MTSEDSGRLGESEPAISRIVSLDVIRGMTILLMVFVNDLGPAAPGWMHHIQPPDADGMTLADIVFPFFLFIAGMSIPLAVAASRARGLSNLQIYRHVLTRTAGLLAMGLVGVNLWSHTTFDPRLWGLLSYIAILLAWSAAPGEPGLKRKVFLAAKGIGVIGFVVLLALYRREPVDTRILGVGAVTDWVWLQSQWWGILGLIGWAYLVAATVYLVVGSRREWLMAATGLLMTAFVVSAEGGYFTRVDDKPWLGPARDWLHTLERVLVNVDQYVSLGTQLGSLAALVTAGTVLGTILVPRSNLHEPRSRIRWALAFAFTLFLAGAATDTFAGVNKIAATPAWCFWCASLATLVWAALYWMIDVRRIQWWTAPVRGTGENPLIAYLLHPILLFALGLTGTSGTIRAYAESSSLWTAVGGSAAMAATVCLLTCLIARTGFRIRI